MPGSSRAARLIAAVGAFGVSSCVAHRSGGAPLDGQRAHDPAAAASLAQQVEALRVAQRIPGLAMVVLRDTTVVLARGFGYANVEQQRPVTPETPFNIASVSKPISAVVALRLVQDGRLDLDRPMRRYETFAEFCEEARANGGIFFGDYACTGDALTLRHVLSMTANGQPGTRFWYNPPSYSWASRPMAEVTGVAFSSLVDSLVMRPAGMRNAARVFRRLPLRPELAALLAAPYHVDSTGQTVRSDPPPSQGDGAAGGVIASAMDLARFDIALMSGQLLNPAMRAQLFAPTRTPSGASLPYGLGWFLAEHEARRLAWHTGVWEGQYSALYLKVLSDRPTERVTLILLANSDALQWASRLDEAAIERSPFAMAFLATFPSQYSSR
ncbi:MAG: beta-lactamase family protein [Gemmatimonadaceae bacterium]|nr:beta-lactamase family protein [Gemmatimonadaceae bacterium]